MRGVRIAIASVSALCGTWFLLLTLMALNRNPQPRSSHEKPLQADVLVRKVKPPAPKQQRMKTATQRQALPKPQFAADVGTLAGGLALFEDGMARLADDLTRNKDDASALIMTEDTVDRLPDCSNNPPPRPPRSASARGVSGLVELRLLVGADGRILNSKIVRSEPAGFFDASVQTAVRSWQCEPATYEGRSVKLWITLPVRFKIG